jgi:hypothetical protein
LLFAVNSAKLIIQALGHFSELTASLPHGAQVAKAISAALFR